MCGSKLSENDILTEGWNAWSVMPPATRRLSIEHLNGLYHDEREMCVGLLVGHDYQDRDPIHSRQETEKSFPIYECSSARR